MKNQTEIVIFTDGSSRGNPGPGGWGAIVVIHDQFVQELGGGEPETTNNRMEITAACMALEKALEYIKKETVQKDITLNSKKESVQILVYTDSKYLIQGITQWVHGWIRNGWKVASGEEVANQDLWQRLMDVEKSIVSAKSVLAQDTIPTAQYSVKWNYVGGHAGIPGNERCDEIATHFADGGQPELYTGSVAEYSIDISRTHAEEGDLTKQAVQSGKAGKKSDKRKGRVYSYISMVEGTIQTHATWAECEARVKGVSGARYKKTMSKIEEDAIREEWHNL